MFIIKRLFFSYLYSYTKIIVFVSLAIMLVASCSNGKKEYAGADIETAFKSPSNDSKPWVYWYWMRANATKDGVTRDLEAMAETGLGGAYLMPIGNSGELHKPGPYTIADPPADPLSEVWWKLVVHAAREADRLGLRLAMNACDGWALAGGPWITPEMSMQEVVTTELQIEGGETIEKKLEQPLTRHNYYRDIAILAYPSVEGTNITSTKLKPKATTNIPGLDAAEIVDGAENIINLAREGWIQYEFFEPFLCRSIKLSPDQRSAYQLHRVKLLLSNDGKNFRSQGRLKPTEYHGWQDRGMDCSHAIDNISARFFRFVFDLSGTPKLSENQEGTKNRNRTRLAVRHIELSSQPVINHWQGKAGYRWRRGEWTTEGQCPADLCVSVGGIIDITDKTDSDGILRWTAPPGSWTIHRIGYTTTGETNNPAGTGAGLECDKFSPDAARIQFDGWFGEALKKAGPEFAGGSLWRNHTDSWEAFSQNWSPVFRDEFIKRRGYDPLPWLPAMAGVPVESAELSERFLYDIRRTIADLVCDNFYNPFIKAGKKYGATFSAECIAPTMMSDGLQHFKYADLPMGEFWLNSVNQDKPNDIQDAVCGGHIYGKTAIGAEAFTQNPINWKVDPYYLKPLGDYNFSRGINQFVLHVWAHQAFDKEPGVTLNRVGTFFSGTQTWHKPGKAFIKYLNRCSEMLQQGLPVIDVCYFIGEEQPARSFLRRDLPVFLPEGYSFDCINRDALLTRVRAENGKIILSDGLTYSLLVLPPSKRMTPEVAQKIGELAQAGVPVIGNLPTQSVSLTNYPECDQNVKSIVNKTWKYVKQHITTEVVLSELGLVPDVEFIDVDLTPVYREEMEYFSPPLTWNHRKTEDSDIYFISNQERSSCQVDVAFRIKDRIPELWNAMTGEICDAGLWHQNNGRTIVNLNLAPSGSVFVVFRRRVNVDPVAVISPEPVMSDNGISSVWIKDGNVWASEQGSWKLIRQSGKVEEITLEKLPATIELSGKWTVSFTSGRGSPEQIELTGLHSLSEHENDGIKYFSGTATYKCYFNLTEVNDTSKLFLDLGKVANLAEVKINGNDLGVLWKPPFIVEITDAAIKGRNELSVVVTNTWHNRLVGDAGLPEDKRVGWLLFKDAGPGSLEKLEPSGLIGPVKVRTAVAVGSSRRQ